MIKIFVISIFILISKFNYGQNLIVNPSFEDFSVDKYGNLYAKGWITPNLSTIDYYSKKRTNNKYYCVPNSLFGFHPSFDSIAFIGLCLFSWNGEMEHYTGCLKEPLKKDSIYKISFCIRYGGDSVWIYSKSIELLFTKESSLLWWDTNYRFLFDHGIPLTSSLKIDIEKAYQTRDWIECNSEYKALGGEKFITFGLFYQGDKFIDLCNDFVKKCNNDLKKEKKFINGHDVYPIFTNKKFKPTIKNHYSDYAYYFIDKVSLTPVKKDEEDFTLPEK